MLHVTDSAASAVKALLQREEVQGSAIRLAANPLPDGNTGITFQAVDRPGPDDAKSAASDLDVFVSPELVPALDTAVLDARDTSEGTELFLRPQPEEQ